MVAAEPTTARLQSDWANHLAGRPPLAHNISVMMMGVELRGPMSPTANHSGPSAACPGSTTAVANWYGEVGKDRPCGRLPAAAGEPQQLSGRMFDRSGQLGVATELGLKPRQRLGAVVVLEAERKTSPLSTQTP